MKDLLTIAHGGYSAKYPENTLESYVVAAEAGADIIEMDVVITSDKEVFCFHPIDGIDGLDKEIESTDSSILAAKGFSRLEAVLSELRKYKSKIYFDLKQDTRDLIDSAVSVAKKSGFDERDVVIGSRSEDILKYLKEKYEVIVLGLLQDPDKYAEFFKMGGDIYRLWEADLTQERVEAIHKFGGEVWVTPGHKATVTEPRTAGQASKEKVKLFSEMEVDGVILNEIEN